MSNVAKTLRTVVLSVVGLVLLVLIVAWLSGVFKAKVDPGRTAAVPQTVTGPFATVERRLVPREIRAVGTIRAVHETSVGSRLLAPVQRVHVTAGQQVAAGEVLVELDKADLQARRQQAAANVDSANSNLTKAVSDQERIARAFQNGAATQRELTDAQRGEEMARAAVQAAEQGLVEVETQLEYATIRSPIGGIVIDKLVEQGDLARPGQTLVTLYEPNRLQLEAAVPERLAMRLKVGDTVGVEIEAIDLQCQGQVSEIVPQASPASRSLLVKVTGPCPPGVLSGMFGRLIIPEGQREQLLVPVGAVHTIGQLEMVAVVGLTQDGEGRTVQTAHRRFVRTGQAVDGRIEILAGLDAGEQVLAAFDDG
ncbi:MAG: efflux RND transporter periplasmic adaptor subunit [Phycisphaerales bacterium]|nr:MAG: efflux RND transporter periplasmic adaptor subunit [Phycisphaerales bacterium]